MSESKKIGIITTGVSLVSIATQFINTSDPTSTPTILGVLLTISGAIMIASGIGWLLKQMEERLWRKFSYVAGNILEEIEEK